MLKRKNEHYQMYSLYISDKYSNLGLIGAIGVEDNVLDLFCLSCRALGHNVVDIALNYLKQLNIKAIKYADTGKNQGLFDLLIKEGYEITVTA